jgi:hypothetical protein
MRALLGIRVIAEPISTRVPVQRREPELRVLRPVIAEGA